jgi:hypothetical protein
VFVVSTLTACRREAPSADEMKPAAVQGALTASAAPPGASAAPPVASVAPAPSVAPSAPAAQCKAVGQKGAVSLGFLREERVRLLAEQGYVYALGYTHAVARVRWLRVARAGGEIDSLTEKKGLGEPSDPVVRNGAAYYTQSGSLFRLGPERSASVTLHSAADSPLAVRGDRAFFVDCDRPGKSDRVIDAPLSEGEPRTIAELPHAPGKRCRYSSVAADDREILIADWNDQRVVAISRESGAVRDLVRNRGFVQELMLETNALSFVSARGLERVDRTGARSQILLNPNLVAAPYSRARLQGGSYWLHDDIAYTTLMHLYRLPYQGGAPQTIATFKIADATRDSPGDEKLQSFAVDDQCVYFARGRHKQPAELFALAL